MWEERSDVLVPTLLAFPIDATAVGYENKASKNPHRLFSSFISLAFLPNAIFISVGFLHLFLSNSDLGHRVPYYDFPFTLYIHWYLCFTTRKDSSILERNFLESPEFG